MIGIAVGKQNSPEKPCKHCGSTTSCDCPLDIIEVKVHNHPMCKTCPPETKQHCLTPGDPGPACLKRASEHSSRDLWSGRRIWCPPGDPKGAWYRTEYARKTEKDGIITIHVKLIPEEEWRKTHA